MDEILSVCAVDDFFGCERIYIRSLSDWGYCFSFNMIGYDSIFNDGIIEDFDVYKRTKITKSIDPNVPPEYHDDVNSPVPSSWTPEQGYIINNSSTYPLPASKGRALMTQIKIRNIDMPSRCLSRSSLLFMFLHLPNELPTILLKSYHFKLNTNNLLQISAELKQNDKTLKTFDIQERGCFFDGERNLKFFKSYTKVNCENECMINFTQQQCGCVRLSMPRIKDMDVCKFKDIMCYQTIVHTWPSIYFKSSEHHEKLPDFPCDCMPLCTQIKYTVVDKATLNSRQLNDGNTYAAVSIKFDESQIVKRTNYVTYKLQNFVADIGGLIGLFLGFSLLSLFDTFLKICSCLKAIFERLELKERVQEATLEDNTEDRNEVRTLNNFNWIEDETNVIQKKEVIFTIPERPSTPLVIEDLEL
ncbi:unnamed protein product [Chironomus riparius]|uniref:Uncharacterized protein n=1 Tax=Chironomus riparius TaxID=315576 RepID=A0A9N9WT36_9DIPT|nr:unnamed protein product [Chironomus riparius]